MYNGYYGFYPGTNFGNGLMMGGMNGLRGLGSMGNMGMGMGGMGYGNLARGAGLFSGIRNAARGINWSGILSGTQRTLNVANQIIPMFNQVKPIVNNARTMFRIAGAMREDNKDDLKTNNRNTRNTRTSSNNSSSNNNNSNNPSTHGNSPQFFA